MMEKSNAKVEPQNSPKKTQHIAVSNLKATINHFWITNHQDLSRITSSNRRKRKEKDKNEEFTAIFVAGMGQKMKSRKKQARKIEILFSKIIVMIK